MKSISRWLPPIGLGILWIAASAWAADGPSAKTSKAASVKAVKAAIERGEALLDEDNYPVAVAAFSEALTLDPKSVPALIGRGTAYLFDKSDKLDQALADFNEALRLEPKNSEGHSGRGAVYAQKKDFGKAFAECDEAVRCDPNNSEAYRRRAYVYSLKGDSPKVIADLDHAIRLNPKDVKALYNRALEESNKGELEKAIADDSEAIRLAPANYDHLCGRGEVYSEKRDWTKAIADFSAAIRLKPRKPDTFIARANVFWWTHDFDHAISDLDEALRLDPKNAVAYRNRGSVYNNERELGKALSDLTNAIQFDANDLEAYCCRGVVYGQLRDLSKARADFDKSIAIDPKNTKVYTCRAAVYLENEMLDEAIADFTHLIQLDPDSCAGYYLVRGSIYEKKGDTKKAEEDFALAGQLGLKAVLEKHGLAKAEVSKNAIESVERRIREEVKRLEYPDAVAHELIVMTRDWKLAAMAEELAAAKVKQRHGKVSKVELARNEREIADTLCQEIAAVVRSKDNVRELDEVIRGRAGCCVGDALLCDVLGRSIGLDVQGLDVPIAASGQTFDNQGHLACLIHLADSQVAIADATGNLGESALVSRPFHFCDTYRAKGSYWELKDVHNSSGLHPLVQPLDNEGLLSEILYCRTAKCWAKVDLKSAARISAEAIRRNPNNSHAILEQGLIRVTTGDYDFDIVDFNTAIEKNPLSALAYSARGSTCVAKGQVDRGIADLDEAIRLNPKFAAAYAVRGRTRWQQVEKAKSDLPATDGNKDRIKHLQEQALADYNEAIKLDPKVSSSYKARAEIYVACGEVEKALSDLNEAIRLDPSDFEGIARRYQIDAQKGLENAIADTTKTIRLMPKNAEAYLGRARVYSQRFEIEKARLDLDEAIRLNPKLAAAYALRGLVCWRQAERDRGLAASAGQTTANPASTTDTNKSRSYGANGSVSSQSSFPTTIKNFDNFLNDHTMPAPTKPAGLSEAGDKIGGMNSGAPDGTDVQISRVRRENYEKKADREQKQALADYSDAIRLSPKDSYSYTCRADIYANCGEYDKAIADMTEAIRLDPKSADAYERRGKLYSEKHDHDKAAADFAQAARLKPDDDRYR